jgi:hypothetical protein
MNGIVGGKWSAPHPSLYPWGTSSWYILESKVDGPKNWSGQPGEEEILDSTATLTQTLSSGLQPVAMPTALS